MKERTHHAYMWLAETTDGDFIPQYEADGTENSGRIVLDLDKEGKLARVYRVPVNPGLPSHFVKLCDGKRLILIRREAPKLVDRPNEKAILEATGNNPEVAKLLDRLKRSPTGFTLYLLGFQTTIKGKNYKAIRYIRHDGEYRDTTNFDLAWDEYDETLRALKEKIKEVKNGSSR